MSDSNPNFIYVTGATKYASVAQLHEFALVREKLEKLGFKNIATAADDLPSGDAYAGGIDSDDYFTAVSNHIVNRSTAITDGKYDTVIFLQNTFGESIANNEMRLAREMNLIVMDAKAFIDEQTKKQADTSAQAVPAPDSSQPNTTTNNNTTNDTTEAIQQTVASINA